MMVLQNRAPLHWVWPCLLTLSLSLGLQFAFGQKPFPLDYEGIASVVQMDSMVIEAEKQGFDVAEFIDLVQSDESFYQAFKNLHFHSYRARHKMVFQSKKEAVEATFLAKARQKMLNDSCRSMAYDGSPEISGKFYKRNGDYRYTTAEMYDKVFFTHGTVCETARRSEISPKGIQKYYEALKTFLFEPGQRVEAPLISKKTAIFEPDMMDYYDYEIQQGRYQNNIDSYCFIIKVKEAYRDKKENKTLVKYMETHFSRKDFQVLGRVYDIEYNGLVSCDVRMEIDLVNHQGNYLPERVYYQGTWNIPGKRRETGAFTAQFFAFE